MGSKGSNTTTTTQGQTYTPNAAVGAAGNQAIGMAQNAVAQPFQMPAAPVAGFNPFQTQAFGQTQAMQGMTNPYYQSASNLMQQGSAPVNQNDISALMNPYADSAMANMSKYIFDPQRRQTMGAGVQSAGGQNASRLALTSQNLDKTQGDTMSQALASYFANAQSGAFQNKGLQQQGAFGMANLGTGAQNANLQATGALGNAGATQQQLAQAQLNSPYQQELARIALPYQNAQFLAGVTGGLAPAMGGTTTGTGGETKPAPNSLNSIIGGGLGLAGLGMNAYNSGMFDGFGSGPTDISPGNIGGTSNGSPLDTGSVSGDAIWQRGGRVGMAAGGGLDPSGQDGGDQNPSEVPGVNIPASGGLTPIPTIKLQPGGSGQFHNNLDLSPKKQSGESGGGGGGEFGDVLKTAAMVLPLLLESGGRVGLSTGGTGLGMDDVEDPAASYLPEAANIVLGDTPLPRPNPLGGLTPKMRELFPELRKAAAEKGVNYDIGEGYRSPQRQNGLYAQGRTLPGPIVTGATAGTGNHVTGNAIDVVPTNGTTMADVGRMNTQLTQNDPRFAGIRSGATFKNLNDPAHIELLNNQEARTPGEPGVAGVDVGDLPPHTQMAGPARQGVAGAGLYNPDMQMQSYGAGPNPYPNAAKDNFGRRFAESPWMNLAKAGAGMMASKSPFLGVALGEGMQAGLSGFDEQRKTNLSEQAANQHAQQLAQAAQIHLDQYQRMKPYEQAHLGVLSAQEARANAAASKDRFIVDPRYNGFQVFDRNTQSSYLVKNGEPPPPELQKAMADEQKRTGVTPAVPVATQATQAKSSGLAEQTDAATPQPLPYDYHDVKVQIPSEKLTGPPGARFQGNYTKALALSGQEWAAKQKEIAPDYNASKQVIFRAKQLQSSLDTINEAGSLTQPGPGFNERVALKGWIELAQRAAGFKPGSPEALAAATDIQKLNTTLGFQTARTLGAREAVQIVQSAMAATPGGAMSPESAKKVLAGIRTIAQRDVDRAHYMAAYAAAPHGLDPGQADAWFDRIHPIDRYLDAAKLDMFDELKNKDQVAKVLSSPPKADSKGYKVWDTGRNQWAILKPNGKAWVPQYIGGQ